jgi:hypothetical protein
MGLVSSWSFVALLGVAPPEPAAEFAGSAQPALVVPLAGRSDGQRLRAPDLSFGRLFTLRILGHGRFGTWSLIGSTVGQSCSASAGARCIDIAIAETGIAWRPFGSRVSLFSAVGLASALGMRSPGGSRAPLGIQLVGGLRIDLPSRGGRR